MTLTQHLSSQIANAVSTLYGQSVEKFEFQATRRDFEGDITLVIFPLVKLLRGNPAEIGAKLGDYLVGNTEIVEEYNVVAGFLNIVISDSYYLNFFNDIKDVYGYGILEPKEGEKAIMVEYSSPNTNKPLHLGHVRNNLLG